MLLSHIYVQNTILWAAARPPLLHVQIEEEEEEILRRKEQSKAAKAAHK